MGFDRVSFIGLGDLRIAYRTAGEPDAPTIVLLHALTATGADWEPVVDALARSHRVIAPDARGHGHSDWATSYSLGLFRDDVLGLIEALALDQLTLIGHSFGGTIAAMIAETGSSRLARLIIEDATVPRRADPSQRRKTDEPPGVDPALVGALGAQLAAPDPAWWDDLAGIDVPTLVIAGGPESHIPQDGLAELANRVPGGRLVTIPAGHRIHTNRPVEFAAAVRAFLGE